MGLSLPVPAGPRYFRNLSKRAFDIEALGFQIVEGLSDKHSHGTAAHRGAG